MRIYPRSMGVLGTLILVVLWVFIPPARSNTATPCFSPGFISACAIQTRETSTGSSHGVRCWGSDMVGQRGSNSYKGNRLGDVARIDFLPFNHTLSALRVSSGFGATCAVFDGGRVMCWGDNSLGVTGNSWTTDLFVGASQGDIESLKFLDLSPETEPIIQLGTGDNSNCALFASFRVKCWGSTLHGGAARDGLVEGSPAAVAEDGGGDYSIGKTPGDMTMLQFLPFNTTEHVISITGAGAAQCALFSGRQHIRCWGAQGFGVTFSLDLGNLGRKKGDIKNLQPIPIHAVTNGTSISQLDCGSSVCCALFRNGRLFCWGDNWDGALGQGHSTDIGVEVSTVDLVRYIDFNDTFVATQVSVGRSHCCALFDNGRARCWGPNRDGELGIAEVGDWGRNPLEMQHTSFIWFGPGNPYITKIVAGGSVTCALTIENKFRCIGQGAHGVLANDNRESIGETALSLKTVTDNAWPEPLSCAQESTYPWGDFGTAFCIYGRIKQGQSCIPCKAGSYFEYQPNGQSRCTDCPAGTYLSHIGGYDIAQCLECPAGTYAGSGSALCTSCPQGTYGPGKKQGACSGCGIGFYGKDNVPVRDSLPVSCSPCPQRTSTTSLTASSVQSCSVCPSNAALLSNTTNTTPACGCVQGYTLKDGRCQACPLTTYKETVDDSPCTPCPGGTAVSDDDAVQPAISLSQCTCHHRSFSIKINNACQCQTGYYLDVNTDGCLACPANAYKDVVGNQACLACPPLSTVPIASIPGRNVSACLCPAFASLLSGQEARGCQCAPGYALDLVTSTCQACRTGHYKDAHGNQACTACPPLSTTNGDISKPATSLQDCLCVSPAVENPFAARNGTTLSKCACGPGYYRDMVSGLCRACGESSYKSGVGDQACTACPLNSRVPASIVSLNKTSCRCPLFSSLNRAGTQCLCQPAFAWSSIEGACTPCARPTEYKPDEGNSPCTRCPANEQSLDGLQCDCLGGFYRSQDKGVCTACPPNGNCGTGRLLASNGYWRAPNSTELIQCTPPSACVDGGCAENHVGELCSECIPGHAKSPSGQCVYCPRTNYTLLFALHLPALVAVLAYVYHTASRPKQAKLTILVNYLQVLAQVSLDSDVISALSLFEVNLFQITRNSCVVSGRFTTMWMISIITPFLLLSMLLLWYPCVQIYKKCRRIESMKDASGKSVATKCRRAAVTILLWSYLITTKLSCRMLTCQTVGSRQVLRADPSIECWTDSHTPYAVIAVLFLVFFSCGLPLALLAAMFRPGLLPHLIAKVDVSFLYEIYTPRDFWWEMAYVTRRILFIAAIFIFDGYPVWRAVVMTCLVAEALATHIWRKPFTVPANNTLESLCLQVLLVSFLIETVVAARGTLMTTTVEDALVWCVVALNIMVLILCIVLIAFDFRSALNWFRRRMSRGASTATLRRDFHSPHRGGMYTSGVGAGVMSGLDGGPSPFYSGRGTPGVEMVPTVPTAADAMGGKPGYQPGPVLKPGYEPGPVLKPGYEPGPVFDPTAIAASSKAAALPTPDHTPPQHLRPTPPRLVRKSSVEQPSRPSMVTKDKGKGRAIAGGVTVDMEKGPRAGEKGSKKAMALEVTSSGADDDSCGTTDPAVNYNSSTASADPLPVGRAHVNATDKGQGIDPSPTTAATGATTTTTTTTTNTTTVPTPAPVPVLVDEILPPRPQADIASSTHASDDGDVDDSDDDVIPPPPELNDLGSDDFGDANSTDLTESTTKPGGSAPTVEISDIDIEGPVIPRASRGPMAGPRMPPPSFVSTGPSGAQEGVRNTRRVRAYPGDDDSDF